MDRPAASIHVPTLLSIALLAWPWNVVLWAAESSQIVDQAQFGTIHAPGPRGAQRVLRHGWWDQKGCTAIAPDYDCDEEEGDNVSPFSACSNLSMLIVFPCEGPPALSPTSPFLPTTAIPQERLCRLRC